MFERLLIANRGEIACRIAATARRLGVRTIAVHSAADRDALHVHSADVAEAIGGATPGAGYLDIEAILAAAHKHGAQAIHPGYGFLSENPLFADACSTAGVVLVGPPSAAMRSMGSKSEARRLMAASGVPVLPGYDDAGQDDERLMAEAARLGFPLLIKPTAGGGGKGMRIVREPAEFAAALAGARREAAKSFGDDRMLLERFVERGRHIEIQVFADTHGNVVHLFERDCSLQRRHQKVIEEAPAPGLDDATRLAMGNAAVAAARAVNYVGAGTIEFLFDGREFYFLEMNTRLQVEHPVTEMITGVDLVEWQLRVAAGEPLPLQQSQITRRGHAVEARLYAEDPARGFLPSTGRLSRLRWPTQVAGALRVDTGVREGDTVTVHYDPMIAKLVAWAPDRAAALQRLRDAVDAVELRGLRTNAGFLSQVLAAPEVRAATISTRWLETGYRVDAVAERDQATDACVLAALARVGALTPQDDATPASPWARAAGLRLGASALIVVPLRQLEQRWLVRLHQDGAHWLIDLDGAIHRVAIHSVRRHCVEATIDGRAVRAWTADTPAGIALRLAAQVHEFAEDDGAEHRASAEHEGHIRAPMPGHVLEVRITQGATVAEGAVLVVLEAMKMEHGLTAPWEGTVLELHVKAGDRVEEGAQLVRLQPVQTATVAGGDAAG